jgi:hypothetical protein
VNYVNARVPNAVVAVSAQAMGSAQSVHEVSRPVSAQAISSAQVMRSAQVAPQRQAVLGRPNAPANVPHPPSAVTSRPIVAKTTPPPPPVPFASRQQALQAHPGVPLNTQQMQQIRRSAPPPAQAAVIKQAPPAPQVVKPAVAPNPPRNAMQERPGGQQPSQTGAPAQVNKPAPPPAYRPPAQPVQPAYHPPASPPVEQPANRPANASRAPGGNEACECAASGLSPTNSAGPTGVPSHRLPLLLSSRRIVLQRRRSAARNEDACECAASESSRGGIDASAREPDAASASVQGSEESATASKRQEDRQQENNGEIEGVALHRGATLTLSTRQSERPIGAVGCRSGVHEH